MTLSPEELRGAAAHQDRLAVEALRAGRRKSDAHKQRAIELRMEASALEARRRIESAFRGEATAADETPSTIMDGAPFL